MDLDKFLQKLSTEPETVQFTETMATIDARYEFTPTGFTNGALYNEPGQNNGSCKLLAFAQRQALSESQVLACFGEYYRNDVLGNPDGDDHQNIRNFIRHGWSGVKFESEPLRKR